MDEKFKIERIDEKMARKTDQTESVTILNMDFLRTQKSELEEEVQVKQKILTEVSEIIEEFDKLPVPPKNESVAEPEVADQPVPSEEAPVDEPAPEE
jgi:hypothetical protein